MNNIDQGSYYAFDDKINLSSIAALFRSHLHQNSPQADSALFLREQIQPPSLALLVGYYF